MDDEFDDDLDDDEDEEDFPEDDDEADDEDEGDEDVETWQVLGGVTVPLKVSSGLTSGSELPRLARISQFS